MKCMLFWRLDEIVVVIARPLAIGSPRMKNEARRQRFAQLEVEDKWTTLENSLDSITLITASQMN